MTSFRHLHQPTGRVIQTAEGQFLFFGGTAYLGLLDNPDYIALFKEGIDRYGLNNGTSRNNNVQLGIYDEIEDHLAGRFGFEEAAIFSSGYLAAQAIIQCLAKTKKVIYAPDSHPALWIAGNPNVDFSFEEWIQMVVKDINSSSASEFLVVSNTLDNLLPKQYDFKLLREIDVSKKVTVVLDDSHGLAVCRKNSISIDKEIFAQNNLDLVIVASLAKGLGTDAGVVLGSKEMVSVVKSSPIFGGGSPASPASMYALLRGQEVYEAAFDRLQHNVLIFDSIVRKDVLNRIVDFPVFTSKDSHLYRRLINQGMIISSFPYPLPTSPLLNRVVVSSLHQTADLEQLAAVING